MYGKIFGIYQVCDPWVYVADPEIIKQICIKVRLTFQRSFVLVKISRFQI